MSTPTSQSEKIQLAVLNENTLGYIMPELPNHLYILHASVLRGATATWPFTDGVSVRIGIDKIRAATKKDFDEYYVQWQQYDRPEFEWNRG